MAAYGAESNKGADTAAGVAYLKQAVPADRRAGHERPGVAADVHLRQGRRDDRVRERRDLRAAERSADRLHGSGLDDPDREPGRGHQQQRAPDRRRRRSSTSSTRRPRRRSTPQNGYRPIVPGADIGAVVPDAVEPVHDRRPRRLDEGHEGLLRRRAPASWPASSSGSACADDAHRPRPGVRPTTDSEWRRWRLPTRAPSGSGVATPDPDGAFPPTDGTPDERRDRGEARRRQPGGVRRGRRRHRARSRCRRSLYLSLIVLIPLAAVVYTAAKGGSHYFWDTITTPGRVGRAQAHGRSVRCWSRSST